MRPDVAQRDCNDNEFVRLDPIAGLGGGVAAAWRRFLRWKPPQVVICEKAKCWITAAALLRR